MGPYAGVDYNLTLYPLRSRLQHIYNRQATLCQSRLYPPVRDFGFGLCTAGLGLIHRFNNSQKSTQMSAVMKCMDFILNSKSFSLLFCLGVSAMVVIESQLITPSLPNFLVGWFCLGGIIFMTIPGSVKKPEVGLYRSNVPCY